ncbi:MAG: hypothetical protein Kow0092_25330 [Deferrisomatales bacterium]
MPEREVEFLQAFHRVSMAITSLDPVGVVLNRVAEQVAGALGAKGASIRLLDRERGEWVLCAAHGLSLDYLEKGAVHADRSIEAAAQGRTVWIEDAGADPRVEYPEANRREGIRSILSVAMAVEGEVIGALRLYFGRPRALDPQEIRFAEALASQAAVAIRNARAYEQLQKDYREVLAGMASL